VVAGWLGGGRSFDASRLRIAEVKRGDLVRDISADGRVIAANSPTLYAIAAARSPCRSSPATRSARARRWR
jgi:HlyD family secretion protein